MGDRVGRVEVELNKAYKDARSTQARYRLIYGGSGSGKSHYIGQEILLNMISDGDYHYLAVRKTGKSIRLSVYKMLTSLIAQYGLMRYFVIRDTDMSIHCVSGSWLVMSGLNDVEKLKSITDVNRIWVEEASEISEQDFRQLDLRMRGKNRIGYQMTMSFNPISELHWLKKVFFDVGKENSFILRTTYKDNSFVDDQYKRNLELLEFEDYQYYRIYALGEWGELGNVIFKNWEKTSLKEIKDGFDNYFNGLDFGFADDPLAFIRVHYDRKHKTIYVTDEIYQTQLLNDEASELLKPIVGNEVVTSDSSEPKSIADLKRYGINAKGAKKGKDSVLFGVKWLQGHKIIIDDGCVNFIREISGYKWREDKDGNVIPKPVDFNNHLIDALRYALESEMVEKEKWGW